MRLKSTDIQNLHFDDNRNFKLFYKQKNMP